MLRRAVVGIGGEGMRENCGRCLRARRTRLHRLAHFRAYGIRKRSTLAAAWLDATIGVRYQSQNRAVAKITRRQ